jgi:hypothetical protein
MSNETFFKDMYPKLEFHRWAELMLRLWQDERRRKRKGDREYAMPSDVEAIPASTFRRLIASNAFRRNVGVDEFRGRPRDIIVAKAGPADAEYRAAKALVKKKLGLHSLVRRGVEVYVVMNRSDQGVHRPRIHATAVLRDHNTFLEVRAFASTRARQGFGTRLMRFLQDMKKPLFLYSSAEALGFYMSLGFRDCDIPAFKNKTVQFTNATALLFSN